MRPKHYVTVYLPPELAAAAGREASRRGIPVARLLRLALEAELARTAAQAVQVRSGSLDQVRPGPQDQSDDPLAGLAVVAE